MKAEDVHVRTRKYPLAYPGRVSVNATSAHDTVTSQPGAERVLVLVRHSKAARGMADVERPLTEHGEQMAADLARQLASRVVSLDLLLVSPAARTRQTARPLRDRMRPQDTRVEETLYSSGPAGVLEQLTLLDDEVRSVVVVGHEPTTSVLAHELDDGTSSLAQQIEFGVPPATALVLTVPVSWSELGTGRAQLAEILTPR